MSFTANRVIASWRFKDKWPAVNPQYSSRDLFGLASQSDQSPIFPTLMRIYPRMKFGGTVTSVHKLNGYATVFSNSDEG
jgi:hypothetical protein